jgi:hypothetical protein
LANSSTNGATITDEHTCAKNNGIATHSEPENS